MRQKVRCKAARPPPGDGDKDLLAILTRAGRATRRGRQLVQDPAVIPYTATAAGGVCGQPAGHNALSLVRRLEAWF